MIAFCQTILKFNNDRKRDDITALVKFFEQHISEYANEKIILELAGYVVLVDDEPVDDVQDEYMEIKRKVLADDRKARFFFSRAGTQAVTNFEQRFRYFESKGIFRKLEPAGERESIFEIDLQQLDRESMEALNTEVLWLAKRRNISETELTKRSCADYWNLLKYEMEIMNAEIEQYEKAKN
jgi:hypothetical protein